MKRLTAWTALIFLLAAILCGCSGGSVNNVNRIIGSSMTYTTAEIEAAMDTVVEYFKAEFAGCTLTELSYQEGDTKKRATSGPNSIRQRKRSFCIPSSPWIPPAVTAVWNPTAPTPIGNGS